MYLHVPFCIRKCPYCAFYSVPMSNRELVGVYLDAVELEASKWSNWRTCKRPIRTLYIGGGTPSLLSVGEWERLKNILERNFNLDFLEEATVEANPGSLNEDLLTFWKEWRITRVSIGCQSFDKQDLLILGRPHGALEGMKSLELALVKGFHVSCDLLFGLPGQTIRRWHANLETALRLGVHHVSCYQLTLEEGTQWGKSPPQSIPSGYPFYRWAQYYLEKKGLYQYEIASFALRGFECSHNLGYWYRRDCIGIGPGAWGFIRGRRYKNVSSLKDYVSRLKEGRSIKEWSERLIGLHGALEAAMLGLRTRWGIDEIDLIEEFGKEKAQEVLLRLEDVPEHLLKKKPHKLVLTRRGMRVGNAIWEKLVS
ncbi:MAG: hypothetical protein PWP05_33 [Thermovirga sp.]|nr:radical SAM family heme chaperone HemW [Thermovirga lienii]MDN5367318.1 hypothetical protein [Thermovirga sp.]